MPYELFLALRYLYSRRRRRLARVTALAAIVGIAFGVAALIVALSLSNGFRDEMRDKILKGTAHITLMRRDGQMMTDWRAVRERVRKVDGVTDATATTYEGALLSGPRGSAYAVLRGLHPESERAIAEVRRTLIAGTDEPLLRDSQATDESPAPPASNAPAAEPSTATGGQTTTERGGEKRTHDKPPAITSFDEVPSEAALPAVIIGAELAARTGLQTNDVAQLISGDAQLTPLGLAPRYRRVRVAGIFRSGLYEYDAASARLALACARPWATNSRPLTGRKPIANSSRRSRLKGGWALSSSRSSFWWRR
jgi:lipoprotein-releasing system permease protein